MLVGERMVLVDDGAVASWTYEYVPNGCVR
jgi:hypothetical protein